MTINHRNGVRDDNRIDNMEVCTSAENSRHAAKHLGMSQGERNPAAKLKREDVPVIRELYATGNFTQTAIAERFGVTQITISRVVRGTYWR